MNPEKDDKNNAVDINKKIAAIETKADVLAQKNTVPEDIAAAREEAAAYKITDEHALSLSAKKHDPRKRLYTTIAIAAVTFAVIVIWLIPVTRHSFLNMLGVRGSMTIAAKQAVASAEATTPSLKNFTYTIDGQQKSSGDVSSVTVNGQTLGKHTIEVAKPGYAAATQDVIIDFDPFFGLFGTKKTAHVTGYLVAKGLPVAFVVKDWTSKLAISEGEYSYGDVVAKPGKDGKVSLIVPPDAGDRIAVKAEFNGSYLGKSFEVSSKDVDQEAFFVPAGRHYFVSKRSGVYSIYSSYLDGSDLKEIVKGTTQETAAVQFAVSPSGKYGIMASTRDGRRDGNGNLMQRLYWVNLSSGKLEELDSAQYFNLYDWSGDTIAYSYYHFDQSANEYRQKLRSVDAVTRNQYELSTTTGFFNLVYISHGMAVFMKQEGFGKTGSEKQQTVHTVGLKGQDGRELATNIGEMRQLGFEKFAYQTADKKWNELNANTSQIRSIEPPQEQGSAYIATENSQNERVYVNFVDGKRILMLQKPNGESKELATQPGLSGPIRFINATTIVFRVITPMETADYAISTRGGSPQKITDVTASSYASPVFFPYY